MPELGSYGSVRGARGNSRPYRERHLLAASSSQFDPNAPRAALATQHLHPLSAAIIETWYSVSRRPQAAV